MYVRPAEGTGEGMEEAIQEIGYHILTKCFVTSICDGLKISKLAAENNARFCTYFSSTPHHEKVKIGEPSLDSKMYIFKTMVEVDNVMVYNMIVDLLDRIDTEKERLEEFGA